MKKFLSAILVILMVTSVIFVTGCQKEEEKLKLGMGVYSYYEGVKNADGETLGHAQVVATAAAVLLDANGKIVQCDIDTADNTVQFSSIGKYAYNSNMRTKGELGDEYGMKAYAGSAKEWYEQVDALEALTVGKTIDEVKALVATEGKGNADVIAAGCTIAINDFVLAIEKAVKNAKESNAVASNTLQLGASSGMDGVDATADKAGSIDLETCFVAAAIDAEGKVVAATGDCLATTFAFDINGVCSTDTTVALSTKREKGDDYGMKAYGGAEKEWYEQADAFAATCIGKTQTEIGALVTSSSYGVEEVQNAGCTITVDRLVKAAFKASGN